MSGSNTLLVETLDISGANNNTDIEIDLNMVTEKCYLEMADDFKNRMKSKNNIIHNLQKKIILIYGLVERFMEVEDPAFIEETRMVLEKCLIEEIGIQDTD
jgi:hypothetical protein